MYSCTEINVGLSIADCSGGGGGIRCVVVL